LTNNGFYKRKDSCNVVYLCFPFVGAKLMILSYNVLYILTMVIIKSIYCKNVPFSVFGF